VTHHGCVTTTLGWGARVGALAGWQLALGLLLGLVLAPVVGALLQVDSELTVYLEVAAVLSGALVVSVLVPLRRALRRRAAADLVEVTRRDAAGG
jgi:hypothetical protein